MHIPGLLLGGFGRITGVMSLKVIFLGVKEPIIAELLCRITELKLCKHTVLDNPELRNVIEIIKNHTFATNERLKQQNRRYCWNRGNKVVIVCAAWNRIN